jgi:hypothetical protein
MSECFKNKTMSFRHKIVRTVAPGLYKDAMEFRRPMDFFLQNYFGAKSLVGVEVGVWRGDHAKQMLGMLNLDRLVLVDSWLPFVEGTFVFSAVDAEKNFIATKEAVSMFRQVEVMRMLSVEAAKKVSDGLDFVYVDADHTYKGVKADLAAWFPKIRMGGVFGGHDFSVDFQSVVRAVVEFAYEHDAKLYFKSPDWWLIKGEVNVEFFK